MVLRLVVPVFAFLVSGSAWAQQSPAPLVVGAIGDSITAGFDAVRLGDNRELSWATGDSSLINSHAKRLGAQSGRTVTSFNEAIAGSVVTDLDRQVDRLLTHAPDYVTVDVGANDICTWNAAYDGQLAAYEQHLHDLLGRIITAYPSVKIVLAPIPNIYNLWQVASPHEGCQAKWDLIGICRPLLASNVSDADRQAFVVRWQAANAAITRVAQEYPANVLHDPGAANTTFTWDHVSSVDCFHPSVAGQNLLAEVAWKLFADE